MESRTTVGIPAWRDSPYVCALADGERHLGHVIKEDNWMAFDATHAGGNGKGIRQLGAFSSVISAKEAVERSVAIDSRIKSSRAIAAGTSIQ
jgi:hypothetical protein